MSSCNYSNLPSVVELRAVRGRDEYRWKKMGALLSANVFCIPVHFVSSFPIFFVFRNISALASECAFIDHHPLTTQIR